MKNIFLLIIATSCSLFSLHAMQRPSDIVQRDIESAATELFQDLHRDPIVLLEAASTLVRLNDARDVSLEDYSKYLKVKSALEKELNIGAGAPELLAAFADQSIKNGLDVANVENARKLVKILNTAQYLSRKRTEVGVKCSSMCCACINFAIFRAAHYPIIFPFTASAISTLGFFMCCDRFLSKELVEQRDIMDQDVIRKALQTVQQNSSKIVSIDTFWVQEKMKRD